MHLIEPAFIMGSYMGSFGRRCAAAALLTPHNQVPSYSSYAQRITKRSPKRPCLEQYPSLQVPMQWPFPCKEGSE